MLLFEDDVVALAEHLAVSGLIVLDETTGRIRNGPALEWTRKLRTAAGKRGGKSDRPVAVRQFDLRCRR